MFELAIGIVALLWTIYQQYSINQICAKCPIRQQYTQLVLNKEIEKN